MTTSAKDHLLDWLRDAHAMEEQAEHMLRSQSSRLEHYPQLKARIDQHIEETREQQRMVKSCIDRLGGSTSAIKDMAARITAFGQGLSGMFVSDEVVKGSMAGYVFEHMEIAAYTTLRAAAQHCGDTETVRVCDAILPQERAMAEWLSQHLPEVTQAFLTRAQTPGLEAKR
ncbi:MULTISPECIES: ferritin-like domain-containing protein [Ralstonia]|uniref:Domain of uncharacterized function (DUF892) n=1 Tax=Ralstonia mannitolilytica TaxID=105219 RepID=A0AAJ5D681_9RALS|nr:MULTISPECIES: DUF892 family protein [Ralstonia]AJW47044.1 hypothetical protein TK49_20360 [Ralstonia mannitolilytica]MBU9577369.1 DUF892 family protein [Ralstonia mannitolilytica]QIF09382.1 ferritin-like domain-containing protein [Ralstonia mannitolilytica]CAG2130532.1 Protein YciE [Ralstonia mannitolilytica]CAJ0731793.1 Protein YciE [Ralstonia mannitolilytica]